MECPISNLPSTEVFRNLANSVLQIVPPELERLPVASDSAYGQMNVRVLRIMMSNGEPFEVGTEINCQASDQVARQPFPDRSARRILEIGSPSKAVDRLTIASVRARGRDRCWNDHH
jgi:hypothetical protein